VRNAFDIGRAPTQDGAEPRARLDCTGQRRDMQDWRVGGGFAAGLGQLRGALYDERDRLNRDVALDLSRHYLYHGFGAEALFWLSRLDAPPHDLVALARLVEHGRPDVAGGLADSAACSDQEIALRYAAGQAPDPLSRDAANRV
jgi:hypothetical protein